LRTPVSVRCGALSTMTNVTGSFSIGSVRSFHPTLAITRPESRENPAVDRSRP
jgi:hypothetical protein